MYKKFLCCLLAIALVLVSGGARLILPVDADSISGTDTGNLGTITTMNDFTDDCVMVVLTHEASLQFVDYTPADFPELECAEVDDLSSAKGAKVQAVLRGEQLDMDSIGARFMNQNIDVEGFRRILCLRLANPGKGNVLRAVMALEQREDVYFAEPNYILTMEEPIEQQGVIRPDDHVYGWAATKIQQEAAWEIETGSSSVLVGVVDTGIDASHPELSGKVSTTLSRNFVSDSYSATTDPRGHGTHVAGIIGAKYNNDELNFSGVCQNVTLVSLRVIDLYNQTTVLNVINAINHAENNNISLLNLSLTAVGGNSQDLMQAVANFSGLLICSIGNNGHDADVYGGSVPAMWGVNEIGNNDNIVSIGASTSSDTRESLSNYGETTVDLFAPGDAILSAYPRSLCASYNCSAPGHSRYGYHAISGTSQATPFVTGVAALILARHPNISPAAIKTALINSVDSVSAFSNICVSGGRLNAYNALQYLE